MHRLATGDGLRAELWEQSKSAKKARLAVAFWGVGARDELGLTSIEDVDVVCDLNSNGTNPFEVEKLIDGGARVHDLPGLHAKLYLFDGVGAVGSSNASLNGLAERNARGERFELNVVFDATDPLYGQAAEQYAAMRACAKPVAKADLDACKAAWLANPRQAGRNSATLTEDRECGGRFMSQAERIAQHLFEYETGVVRRNKKGWRAEFRENSYYVSPVKSINTALKGNGNSGYDFIEDFEFDASLRSALGAMSKHLGKINVESMQLYDRCVHSRYSGTYYRPTVLGRMVYEMILRLRAEARTRSLPS